MWQNIYSILLSENRFVLFLEFLNLGGNEISSEEYEWGPLVGPHEENFLKSNIRFTFDYWD